MSAQNTKGTNGELYKYHMEIGQFQQSIFKHLLKSPIKEFYRNNQLRIQSMFGKITKLQDEYFVVEEGKIKYEGEEGKTKPVMQEGKTYEEYTTKYNELMAQEVPIMI